MRWEVIKFLIAAAVIAVLFFGMCWAGDYQKREDQE